MPLAVRTQRRSHWLEVASSASYPILTLGFLTLAWEAASRAGLIAPFILPAPSDIAVEMVNSASELWMHRDDLTADELRQVIREEMANVVDVQVTVRDNNPA